MPLQNAIKSEIKWNLKLVGVHEMFYTTFAFDWFSVNRGNKLGRGFGYRLGVCFYKIKNSVKRTIKCVSTIWNYTIISFKYWEKVKTYSYCSWYSAMVCKSKTAHSSLNILQNRISNTVFIGKPFTYIGTREGLWEIFRIYLYTTPYPNVQHLFILYMNAIGYVSWF